MQQLPTINRINPMIEGHFEDRPDVLVTGEAYLCWDPTNKNAKLSPDCMVAIGINPEDVELKNGYLIWEIGKPPDVVIEVASEHTARADMTRKRDRYASLGIAEYWRLDPSGGDRYGEPLIGEYLSDGEYRRYEPHTDAVGVISAYSEIMGINLLWDGPPLRHPRPYHRLHHARLSRGECDNTANGARLRRRAPGAPGRRNPSRPRPRRPPSRRGRDRPSPRRPPARTGRPTSRRGPNRRTPRPATPPAQTIAIRRFAPESAA